MENHLKERRVGISYQSKRVRQQDLYTFLQNACFASGPHPNQDPILPAVRRTCAVIFGLGILITQTHAQQLERAKTTNYQIPSDVVSSGGGDGAKSTNYLLDDTIGESNIGFGRSNNYDLNAGYRQPDGGTFLAMGCEDLTNIGTITFTGQATADNTCTVITDNDAGYALTWSVLNGSGGTNTGHLISTTAPHTQTIKPFNAETTGLVAYLKMEESAAGSTVKDYSGTGNNGTPNGAAGANNKPQPSASVPTNINTMDRYSLSFDGTDDHVSTTTTNFTTGTSPRTIAGWIKPTASATLRVPFAYGVCGAGNEGKAFGLYISALNVLNFWGCGGSYDFSTGTSITDGVWTHVAVTYDGTNVRVYVNGVQAGSATARTLGSSTASFEIGGAHLLDSGNYYFPGSVDEVRVYNRALSLTEVQALSSTPQTWSVASNKAFWGARLRSSSTDTDSKWGTDSSSEKWLNIGDGTYPVVSRASRTSVAGSTQILQFRAEVGATAIVPTGVYETTVTLTASSL